MMLVGRQLQGEELRELLFSPTTPPQVESVVGAPPCPCDGRRRGSKRSGRDDDEPAAAARHSCKTRRRRTKQQHHKSSKSLVTSVPDFDGYQWRKYGQKQIEGALYARSYYRCTRSAEQGCGAKRTVQRNDDDLDGAARPAEYTVVYMGEHTCTPNEEAPPVILETAVPAADNKQQQRSAACYDEGADQSPAISDVDIITWSSSSSNDMDDYCGGAHADSWQDFISGPIRSPVHVVPAADAWMIHHYFLIDDAAANE